MDDELQTLLPTRRIWDGLCPQVCGQSSRAKDIRLLVQRLNAGRGRCAADRDRLKLTEPASDEPEGLQPEQSAAPRADWSSFVEAVEVCDPRMVGTSPP